MIRRFENERPIGRLSSILQARKLARFWRAGCSGGAPRKYAAGADHGEKTQVSNQQRDAGQATHFIRIQIELLECSGTYGHTMTLDTF